MGKRSGHLRKEDIQEENKIYREKKIYKWKDAQHMSLGNYQLRQHMRYEYTLLSGHNLKPLQHQRLARMYSNSSHSSLLQIQTSGRQSNYLTHTHTHTHTHTLNILSYYTIQQSHSLVFTHGSRKPTCTQKHAHRCWQQLYLYCPNLRAPRCPSVGE